MQKMVDPAPAIRERSCACPRSGLSRRQQVHGNVMRAVARHWKIERFGEPRDLHKDCDATAIRDIGLGVRHCASRNIVLKLPERAQVLASRDRYAAGGHNAGMTSDIV